MTKPLSGQQVADLAGISASGVSKLKAAEDPLHRGAGGYDPVDVGRWLYRRALATVGKTDGEGLDLSREQALLARARRLAIEAEAEIRSGKYTLTEDANQQAFRVGMTIRDGVLSVPGRLAIELAVETDERRCERLMMDALRAELTRLANLSPVAAEHGAAFVEQAERERHAAAAAKRGDGDA